MLDSQGTALEWQEFGSHFFAKTGGLVKMSSNDCLPLRMIVGLHWAHHSTKVARTVAVSRAAAWGSISRHRNNEII